MTIVVGYDGRREGRDALALAAALAPILGEDLLVASVYPSPETSFGLTSEELHDQGRADGAEGAKELPEGVDATPVAVPATRRPRGSTGLLEAEHPSMVVVGSSHRGPLGNVLAGRVATRLLTASPCPVAVAPRGFAMGDRPVLRKIGVGFDDTPESWNAVQRAAAIGIAAGARLRIIHALQPVVAPPMVPDQESERLTRELRVRASWRSGAPPPASPRSSTPRRPCSSATPCACSSTRPARASTCSCSARAATGPCAAVLLGGVSDDVVRRSPCPVLVVPRSVDFDPSAGGMAAHDMAAPAPHEAGHVT